MMIPFQKLTIEDKPRLEPILMASNKRSCEYSFGNLYLWGRKSVAIQDGFLLVESKFDRKNVYLFPVGQGDIKKALDALIHDAGMRRLSCCIAALTEEDCRLVEQLYPGKFSIYCDRDSYDYVYDIGELAELKGRRFQKKRNHLNRFRKDHETAAICPLDETNLETAREVARRWYENRCAADPDGDYHLEQRALRRAFDGYKDLDMEGVALVEDGRILAFAMGSRLNSDTFDIHFEKALEADDGTYAAINQGFAAYLREKHPELKWLNREDDMGIEGLRKAKLSYCPTILAEKCWAQLREDEE